MAVICGFLWTRETFDADWFIVDRSISGNDNFFLIFFITFFEI